MKISQEDQDKLVALYSQLQSALHTLDDISVTPVWRNELKSRSNFYINFLEKKVINPFTCSSNMGIKEGDSFLKIVNKFDELAKEVYTTVKIKD
ncbi:MAG: hypothetical protein ACJASM_003062 [Salibacteraceae bacterium]|jgi:hypothetical protein